MHNRQTWKSRLVIVITVLILSSLACSAILPGSDEEPSPTGKPDLVVSTGHAGMELTGSCLEEYGPIKTKVCVENRGEETSNTFMLAVNEGTNWTIARLGAGETICFDSDSNLSGATVTVDSNNQVDESNENNNTWTIPVPTPPILCTQEADEPTPTPEPDISYQGISFSYDDFLASSVTPEMVPAQVDAAIEPWNNPDYVQFTFNGYPLPNAFHTPRIMVYPVNAYIAINSTAGDIIFELEQFLASKPSNPESIPFLPVFNAAQFLHTQVGYITFQNGEGVRFLTQYGQAAWPVNNDDMFYTFQGITDDGQFYISAVLPISHPSLPDPETMNVDEAFYNNFTNYVIEIEDQLNTQSPDSFAPTLSMLDGMIESLLVTGPN